jgi:glycosyltransferase involved in cell wall biosynthesis
LNRVSSLVLQPDPQVLWIPEAVRQGRKLVHEFSHSAIVVTAPPFSAFFVGAALARQSRLPLVLDYRDEWTLSGAYWENRRMDSFSRRIQTAMQRRVVRSAQSLVATTRASAMALDKIREEADSPAQTTCIYNGFDPDDFSSTQEVSGERKNVFRLAYVGTLWNLTSVAPLARAVQLFCERHPDLRDDLELIFIGRRTSPQEQILEDMKKYGCRIVDYPYMKHIESVNFIRSADGLCLLLSDLPGAERVVPAKVFEYLAAKKAILAIAPRGEVWDILKHYPEGSTYVPGDIGGITNWLVRQVRAHKEGHSVYLNGWDPAPFGRSHQARQLSEILDSLAAIERPNPRSVRISN